MIASVGHDAQQTSASGPHAAAINRLPAPGGEELERAPTIVAAFESAGAKGQARVARQGSLIEVPGCSNVNHLIARGGALREFHR